MAVYTPTVRTVANGQPVEASVTNQGVQDLAQRTDWLKQQLQASTAGVQLVIKQQPVTPSLAVGTPVYLDTATSTFKAALGAIDPATYKTVLASSMWQGIVLAISGSSADILIAGVMQQSTAAWATIFESGVFAAGPVYLSETSSGKYETAPGALGIYIGVMRADGTLMTRGATASPFATHVHLQRTLLGQPAGTVVDPAFGGTQVVTTPNPASQGWLPATNLYFPGFTVGLQIPTGAKFGYNVQHPSETALRQIFPVVPADNAVFVQGGLTLDTTQVVCNQYGIWWMDDSYGNAPWPVDYSVSLAADSIALWTAQLMSTENFINDVAVKVLQTIQTNIGDISVARILAGNGISVSGTNSDGGGAFGTVTILNSGVRGELAGFGVRVYDPSVGVAASASTPATGNTRLFSTVPRDAQFIPGQYSTYRVLSSFGMDGGTPIGQGTPGFTADVYGYGINNIAGDFLFRFDPFGASEVPVVPAKLKVRLTFAVNAASVGTVTKTFYASLFCVANDGIASSTNSLSSSQQVSFSTGTSGKLYTVDLEFASGTEFLNAAQTCILRINRDTLNPSTALDVLTLVVVGVSYVVEPVNLTT